MTVEVKANIICDRCGAKEHLDLPSTSGRAVSKPQQLPDGWAGNPTRPGKHLCPECREKRDAIMSRFNEGEDVG